MSNQKICPLRMAAWESCPENMLLENLDKAESKHITFPTCIEERCGFWSQIGEGNPGQCAVASIPRQLSHLTDTLHTIEEGIK